REAPCANVGIADAVASHEVPQLLVVRRPSELACAQASGLPRLRHDFEELHLPVSKVRAVHFPKGNPVSSRRDVQIIESVELVVQERSDGEPEAKLALGAANYGETLSIRRPVRLADTFQQLPRGASRERHLLKNSVRMKRDHAERGHGRDDPWN